MRLFKKKSLDYSYYSPYSKHRPEIRFSRNGTIIAVVIALAIAALGYLNFNRVRLMMMGYDFSTANKVISKLDSAGENAIINEKVLNHLSEWLDLSDHYDLYDEYEAYYVLTKKKTEKVVKFIDGIYVKRAKDLDQLGYDADAKWVLAQRATLKDVDYLIKKKYKYKKVKNYLALKGCIIKKMPKYIKAYKKYKDYSYAVNFTNYPFTISTEYKDETYTIANPDTLTCLVKKGFLLAEDYIPDDLTTPKVPIAYDCDNKQVRQECADALVKLFEGAKDAGYNLMLSSGYRAYTTQKKIYETYITNYGLARANEICALPGTSEHQTGLGVDITSEEVNQNKQDFEDGKVSSRYTFGDTQDALWLLDHAYEYGFIHRFATDKTAITGIDNEAWHYRYVGKEVAKICYEHDWTLEEYCLYKDDLPEVLSEDE